VELLYDPGTAGEQGAPHRPLYQQGNGLTTCLYVVCVVGFLSFCFCFLCVLCVLCAAFCLLCVMCVVMPLFTMQRNAI
jgi:hypothetical protein